MGDDFVIGVDIGGSHITAACIDINNRSVIESSRTRMRVNSHGAAEDIIVVWSEAIKGARNLGIKTDKIGIAMPGPYDYENGISLMHGQDKYDRLYGLNTRLLLAEKLNLPELNIRLNNDAACFLQGEVFGGAATGYKRAIGFTLGTGLGTAVFANGVAKDADLWKTPYQDSIAEDYMSTRWFIKRYKELTGREIADVKELAMLTRYEGTAKLVFKEFAKNFAWFIEYFVDMEQPEIVVVGGNIAKAWKLFIKPLEKNISDEKTRLMLCEAMLAEDAALIGSAHLWK